MSRPHRVTFFITDLSTGGAESHLARLLPNLNRDLVDPDLVLLHALGEHLDDVRSAGVPIQDLDYHHGIGGALRLREKLRAHVRHRRSDVIHSYGHPCDLFAAVSTAPRGRLRVVTSRRGNQQFFRRRLFNRITNHFVDHVVCVSRATEAFACRTEGLSTRRCTVIPNGIDLSQFPDRPRDAGSIKVIGTLARLRHVKGVDLLLDAFARLGRPGVTLKMGGPADREWGKALRSKHLDQPGVVFLDEVRAPEFLPAIDLFVLPSRSEGMSNALLEAMASGLPIVATDVGGNREVLADGAAGLLVEPSVESIAAGVTRLLDDPARAAHFGRKARERVEHEYTFRKMVERYESFYHELVGGDRGP